METNGNLNGNLYIKLPDGTIHKVLDIQSNDFTHTPLSIFVNFSMLNYIMVSLPDNYFEYEEGEE